jgi:CRP-like cAMP-binding protein
MAQSPARLPGSASLMSELLSDPSLEARRLEIADGTPVYESGAPAQHLYHIQSGQVRIYQTGPDDSARLMEILGPGDWFGVEALTDAKMASSRAVVVSATVVTALPVERLLPLLSSQPQVTLELIRQLAGKLQSAREDAGRLVFDDCNVRLVKTLLHFSNTAAATPQEGGSVTLHITHRQLAEAVGAARETVSLALTQLRQQNLLRTGRSRLLFNPEALRAFAKRAAPGESVP